jgi:hypothetical protein
MKVKQNSHNNDVTSIPIPLVSMEELVEIAECAEICSKYHEINPGDKYIGIK